MFASRPAIIANCPGHKHAHHLPPSWDSLYELSRLDEETLTAAIEDGTVNPRMQSPRSTPGAFFVVN
jgi:hypothetical protein